MTTEEMPLLEDISTSREKKKKRKNPTCERRSSGEMGHGYARTYQTLNVRRSFPSFYIEESLRELKHTGKQGISKIEYYFDYREVITYNENRKPII